MSDAERNVEPQSLVGNNARLNSTNAQIGNASQVVNSPGAVVSQTHVTVQASPIVHRNNLIFWALLALGVVLVSRATINIGLPPVVGQAISGGTLAGIVWKFFEQVEAVLTEQTKFEIALWLVGVEVGRKVEPWPETFAKQFDRVFGTKHLSWRCFWRSAAASYSAVTIVFAAFTLRYGLPPWKHSVWLIFICGSVGNLLWDYISLLETRWILRTMSKTASGVAIAGLLVMDATITALIGGVGGLLADLFDMTIKGWRYGYPVYYSLIFEDLKFQLLDFPVFVTTLPTKTLAMWMFAAFFTSIWLWLYAGAGFLLKVAQRFDFGFKWFNRNFDIKHKPLQAIGLVAGTLVALIYWAAVFGVPLIQKLWPNIYT